ncbi:hypothetical protein CALVIDRAFT_557792 [Calocera viscosa TUFC12733]|uniref:Amidoligase enzyme n=1 Tax=Calocera viscosa (strain TUFC12733) TaxID=1330018 RepID=A0A167HYF2_CALVF|nr:hypothetical protein CALVIDRAFT_557792 [Calocera viscosa TUFC12733]
MARTLSIGFEFECLAHATSRDYSCQDRIVDAINLTTAHRARCRFDHYLPGETQWIVTNDASIVARPGECPVELISPPIEDDAGLNLFGPTSQREWKHSIAEVFASLKHLNLWTNPTTGLHVHLAPGIGRTWTLPHLRRIALIFVLLERQLDMYHSPHRWRTSPHTTRYLQSMRRSRFCVGMTNQQLGNFILETRSWQELAALVNPDPARREPYSRYYKVNFTAMGVHGTVEFRQHEGTVELPDIFGWGDTLLVLVRLAIRADDQSLLQLCLSKIKLFDLIALAKGTKWFPGLG